MSIVLIERIVENNAIKENPSLFFRLVIVLFMIIIKKHSIMESLGLYAMLVLSGFHLHCCFHVVIFSK